MTTKKLDELANLYNKTKNQKYKNLWYKEVKELTDGIRHNRSKRRAVSLSEIREERD
jgi:ribosomal protein L18E